MSNWAVKRGTLERQIGDLETLQRLAREKRLRPDDLVFHPETRQWMNASAVPELEEAFAAHPPAAPIERPEVGAHESAAAAAPAGPPATVVSASAVSPVWGASSRVLGVIGGVVAIFGGVSLLGLKAASDNSLIEAVAHGLGIYCIGKGIFMIATVVNMKAAVDFMAQQLRR